jgi:CheY-like chemotaxis protein
MRKKLILIAEDDNDDRYLLQTAFEEVGNEETLKFVDDGVEVMEFLTEIEATGDETRYPDIVILDLNMPKKNGKETLAEIRKRQAFKNIPVIIYTTTRSEQEIKDCYELGANTYIVKPASYEVICEVVLSIKNLWLNTASIPA